MFIQPNDNIHWKNSIGQKKMKDTLRKLLFKNELKISDKVSNVWIENFNIDWRKLTTYHAEKPMMWNILISKVNKNTLGAQ